MKKKHDGYPTSVRLDPETHSMLTALCAQQRTSRSAVLRAAVRDAYRSGQNVRRLRAEGLSSATTDR